MAKKVKGCESVQDIKGATTVQQKILRRGLTSGTASGKGKEDRMKVFKARRNILRGTDKISVYHDF